MDSGSVGSASSRTLPAEQAVTPEAMTYEPCAPLDLLLLEPSQLPQLSQRFSQQMDDAGLTLQDLLEGLAQERQSSSKIRFGQEA